MMNSSFIQTCGHNIKDLMFVVMQDHDNIVSGKMEYPLASPYEENAPKTTKGY